MDQAPGGNGARRHPSKGARLREDWALVEAGRFETAGCQGARPGELARDSGGRPAIRGNTVGNYFAIKSVVNRKRLSRGKQPDLVVR